MKDKSAAFVMLGATLLAGCGPPASPKVTVDDPANPEFYTQVVQPVLQTNCYRCHGWMNHRGGLNIETREGMLKGGSSGPALVPGDSEKSLLVRLMRHEGPADHPMPMPNKGARLPDADITAVARWVNAGAIMPKRDDQF